MPVTLPVTARMCVRRLLSVLAGLASVAGSASARSIVYEPVATGRGIFADLAADSQTGIDLIARQLAQPLQGPYSIILLSVSLLLAGLLFWPGRRWAVRRLTVLTGASRRSGFAIFARAVSTVVITVACFILGGLMAVAGVNGSLRLLPEAAALVNLLFASCVISGIGLGLGTAFRSPDDKMLRPVALPPGLGSTVSTYAFAAGLMLGLVAFIDTASRTLHASATSWTMAQVALVLAEILMIARFLTEAGRARERQAGEAGNGAGAVPVFGLAIVAWAALAAACGALLIGSLRFSMNLLQNMLWAALVLAMAWLMARFLDTLVYRLFGSEKRAARFATGIVGIRHARVEQAAILLSAALGSIIWIIAVLLVLVPMIGTGDNIVDQVRPGPVMDSIRAMHLSPRSLVTALALLIGGIFITRMIRHWFEQRFLPSTTLGIGARTSIVTGLGYVGTIIALIAASGALGLQLDKITLIASALTVGVGFGLQAIIQNFVSGVILLFERPIQPGDRVMVSGSEGKVHRMRVRATELVSDDGSIAIIPNSAFISSTVVNKGDRPGDTAIEIDVTILGRANAAAARDMLLGRIATCDAVDAARTPQLHLKTLRENWWKFGVRFYPRRNDPQDRVISDLLFHLGEDWEEGVTVMAG